jgi:hypothetical protein
MAVKGRTLLDVLRKDQKGFDYFNTAESPKVRILLLSDVNARNGNASTMSDRVAGVEASN